MKIGVVSDTHGFFDPQLREVLEGADAVLHAGDVGSQQVLEELGRIGKVYAVRGNVDPADFDLPLSRTVQLDRLQLEIVHQLPVPQGELDAWTDGSLLPKVHPERREMFLKGFGEETQVVIFGHTHQPCLMTLGHKLFFNPGSAGQRRFSLPRCCGILETFPRGARAELVALEQSNKKLPRKVWLPLGE